MNELTALDNEIDFAESEYVQARDSVLYKMAALGRLYSRKKAELGHGEFLPWIESRIKLDRVEAQRCMKVFIEFPDVLSNSSERSYLNKETIKAILYAPDDVKAEVKERLANGEDITAAEIKRLKLANESLKTMSEESMKAQQDALKAKEDWRQQYLDERNSKRDLAQELEAVRISKKETIYIDDSTKALAQYREETDTKITKLKAEVKKIHEEKLEAIKKVREDIHSGYDEEINRKQQQEMTLNQAIMLAQQKKAEIDKLIMPRIAHAEALKNFRHYLNCLAVEASLIYERDFNNDELESWMALFNDTRVMLNGCENELTESKPNLRLVQPINREKRND